MKPQDPDAVERDAVEQRQGLGESPVFYASSRRSGIRYPFGEPTHGFQDFVNPHVYRVDFFGEAGIETYYLRPRRLKMYIGGGVLLLILIILLIIFLL